jgi:hypothetical protein
MKNLANLIEDSIEYIDNLPSRDKLRPPKDGRDHYKGEDYPWRKVYRFLVSRVGRPWDHVFSEFVHLDWIPRQYKTQEQISHSVLLNTFMRNGKVWYYDKYLSNNERQLEDCGGYWSHSELFYVHPVTKILSYYKPKKIDYKKRRAEEEAKTLRILGDYHQLVKIKGIWHEVKGKPAESNIVVIDGLHYRKAKHIPVQETESGLTFFGRRVVSDKPKFKIVDGEVLIPVAVGNYRYYTNNTYSNDNRIGPRDRMLEDFSKDKPYYCRKNYESIEITVKRQLNHKELKKYGVKNDVKTIGKPCKICGNVNCIQQHHKT